MRGVASRCRTLPRPPWTVRLVHSERAIAGIALAAPLRRRDYATLWAGAEVSFLGDGVYFVAIAWQAYALHDTPAALAAVGLAFTVPNIALLLLGGALSDRFDRRRVLLVASAVQAIGIGAIALLSLAGELRVGVLLALVALYGGAQAFVTPAFEAIVPTLVEPAELAAASALDQVGRRLALQILGPALGGVLVAFSSPGMALLLDAATFLGPMCAVAAIGSARRSVRREASWSLRRCSVRAPIRAGDTVARRWPVRGGAQPAGVLRPLPGSDSFLGEESPARRQRRLRARTSCMGREARWLRRSPSDSMACHGDTGL